MSISAGSGTSGVGGLVSVLTGRSTVNTGGVMSITTGEGTSTSSGMITIRTSNAGTSGVSGMLIFSSGTSKTGNSGSLLLGSGAATAGRGGLVCTRGFANMHLKKKLGVVRKILRGPNMCIFNPHRCQTRSERLGRRRAAADGRQRVAELSPLAQAMPAGPARGPEARVRERA